MGARSRLTGSVVTKILRALAEGLSLPHAAQAAGIPANTVGEWMPRGLGQDHRRQTRMCGIFAGWVTKMVASVEITGWERRGIAWRAIQANMQD
jgi:hypothetical protein